MDIATVGILFGIAINIAAVSFGAGKLWTIASNNSKRLDRIEKKLDKLNGNLTKGQK